MRLTVQQMIDAKEFLESRSYNELIRPLIIEKLGMVEKDICEKDENDHENRGFRRALKWMLNRSESLGREIEQMRKSAGHGTEEKVEE